MGEGIKLSKDKCEYRGCKRKTWHNDDKYCIFHSEKVVKKENEFIKKFKSEFPDGFIQKTENIAVKPLFLEEEINNVLNLEGFVFPKSNFLKYFFQDKQINYNIDFSSTIFLGQVYFSETIFSKKVSFSGAKFSKEVLFSSAKFEDEAVFSSTKFERHCFLRSTKFLSNVSFYRSEFIEEVDLTGAEFSLKAAFVKAKFNSDISLEESSFLNGVDFKKAKFLGKVSLNNIYISGILSLKECKFEGYVDLRMKKCDYINLEESINEGIIDFKPQNNEEVNIKYLSFFNMKNLGHIYIDWYENDIEIAIENQSNDYEYKANQYRILKENYHKLGEYDQEDRAYVKFKKNKLQAQKNNYNKLIYNFKLLLEEKIGLYGTSPGRVALSMSGFVGFFSLVYYLFSVFGYKLIGGKNLGSSFIYSNEIIKSIYHSIVTFLTIGYGDIHPLNPVGMIISGFEGFIGLFLMSYFTVAFVRKVLR